MVKCAGTTKTGKPCYRKALVGTTFCKNHTKISIEEPTHLETFTNGAAELWESNPRKKWIKLVPLDKTIPLENYDKLKYFTKVANIVLDNEIDAKNKKRRQTLIKFDNVIDNEEFNRNCEWLYLFVINGRIVKIGGTRTGLKGRAASYLCGHHIRENGKSGDCSKTNGFIYNTFCFYLEQGCKIEMYGYKLPVCKKEIDIDGELFTEIVQSYHLFESKFLNDYKKRYRDYPFLSDNADPKFKC